MNEQFQWIPFYEELADKLHEFIDRKDELFEIIKEFESEYPYFRYLKLDKEDWWGPRNYTIDPFSVMGVMNRGLADENRVIIGKLYADIFDISASVPTTFPGIPVLNNMRSFLGDTADNPLWELFEEALEYAETKNVTDQLIHAFDNVREIGGNGLAMVTIVLYWIRPEVFMPLDSNSRRFIPRKYNIEVPGLNGRGEEYFNFLKDLNTVTQETPFYEISYEAWLENEETVKPEKAIEISDLTVDDWLELLNDKTIFIENSKIVMKAFLDFGGKATCTQLANEYGRTKNFYNNNSHVLGKKIAQRKNLNVPEENGKKMWWPVLYLGEKADEEVAGSYYWELRPELAEALELVDLDVELYEQREPEMSYDKNIILYGPPGTGKTYSTVLYAVSIIEETTVETLEKETYDNVFSRYLEFKEDGLIEFVTFHQSFSYEDFIEGIRPVVTSEEDSDIGNEIEYEISDGVFKQFANRAEAPTDYGMSEDLGIHKTPTIWKISLNGSGENAIRTESLENNHIRLGWDAYGEEVADSTDFSKMGGKSALNAFYNEMKVGDIVLSAYSNEQVDAIGVVTGEPEWHDAYPTHKRLRNVEWLAKGLKTNIADIQSGNRMSGATLYKLAISVSDVMKLLHEEKPELFTDDLSIPNRVFIIDEINRGNISKIFGELITLLEPSKRMNAKEEMRATLPYSGQKFGVPDNVYLIGTMNTADRSIAMLDTALRRRFSFYEMTPEPALLKGITVEGIDIERLLEQLNKRITILYDRDHAIGHSYFLPLKDNPTIEHLGMIFENRILPLLQEYFYDNYERIQLVLGDNQKTTDDHRFIIQKSDVYDLFGDAAIYLSEYYTINQDAFTKVEAYAYLQ